MDATAISPAMPEARSRARYRPWSVLVAGAVLLIVAGVSWIAFRRDAG